MIRKLPEPKLNRKQKQALDVMIDGGLTNAGDMLINAFADIYHMHDFYYLYGADKFEQLFNDYIGQKVAL